MPETFTKPGEYRIRTESTPNCFECIVDVERQAGELMFRFRLLPLWHRVADIIGAYLVTGFTEQEPAT